MESYLTIVIFSKLKGENWRRKTMVSKLKLGLTVCSSTYFHANNCSGRKIGPNMAIECKWINLEPIIDNLWLGLMISVVSGSIIRLNMDFSFWTVKLDLMQPLNCLETLLMLPFIHI